MAHHFSAARRFCVAQHASAADLASRLGRIRKLLPSTPDDPAIGIADGVSALLAQLDAVGESIAFLGHGTTVVTNLIIERRGAPTALLTTAGFRDVLEIGRQTRPDLYDYPTQVVEGSPLGRCIGGTTRR